MRRSQLTKIINAGGATIGKNGAAANFADGYQVSKKDCYILTVSNTRAILRACNALLKSMAPGNFLGIWIDEGRAYIDISEYIAERSEALRVGKERGQISIFDWATGACVYC